MNKFLELISAGKEKIYEQRAKSLARQAEGEQKKLINNLESKLEEKNLQICDLTDLGPESNTSLRPGKPGWSAAEWVDQLQTAKCEKKEIEEQLKIAKETYKEYFSEAKENK